jgi:hypothetical protein
MSSQVVDGNCPVNKLLDMFNTCRDQTGAEDCSSCRSPVSLLKLMSRTTILLEDNNSSGRLPDKKLWDRFKHSRLVRLPRDAEICP